MNGIVQITATKFVMMCMLLIFCSCEEFLNIDPPRTELVSKTVFESDATAKAALTDVYYQLTSSGFLNGATTSITFLASISADEVVNHNVNGEASAVLEFQQFYEHSLIENNSLVLNLWTDFYQLIYKVNAILEGLASATNLSEGVRNQIEAEATFVRAFCYFYLVNLYGDVPLVLGTDYRENANIGRTAISDVYEQIVLDLQGSIALLASDYSFSDGQRTRPNKSVAKALLARVFLYTGGYTNAQALASEVINDNTQYTLVEDLNGVFLMNSGESIWQLANDNRNTHDATTFYITPSLRFGALQQGLVDSFEPEDRRRLNWINEIALDNSLFFFPAKYKDLNQTPVTEYSMVMRLAEQYLIRAEARAHLGDLEGSRADINMIRGRAGLAEIAPASADELLEAVEVERRHELFTEWAHRWLDLKRTGRADAVLGAKPGWEPTAALYPVPRQQLLNDPAMTNDQNPGY